MDKRKIKKYELFSDELKKSIELEYQKTYSVTKVLEIISNEFEEKVGRNPVVDYLKSKNLYEGLKGPNYLKKKVENNKKIMLEKYGVENYGQLKSSGWTIQNKIPYKTIKCLDEDYRSYRKKVDKITKKNIQQIKSDYCFYTGIKFADIDGPTNPNDPRKKSIDHRLPVIYCYLNEISIEDAGSINNIVYVLRYVNSIKGNTLEESFIPIAKKIRKIFKNEGFESN